MCALGLLFSEYKINFPSLLISSYSFTFLWMHVFILSPLIKNTCYNYILPSDYNDDSLPVALKVQ